MKAGIIMFNVIGNRKMDRLCCVRNDTNLQQEAQLPQRNSASAVHVYIGWLTDRAMHSTPQNRRGCTISDIQTL